MNTSLATIDQVRARALELDAADPLAHYRNLFAGTEDGSGVLAYLDGNSLGRPLTSTLGSLERLVRGRWGTGLIRSWDECWMQQPFELGDRIGRLCLGAAPGQTFVGDSTTVLLYKLLRAAVRHAGPQRPQVVLDTENFPTDRYVAEGVAAESGVELQWIEPDPTTGVTIEQVADQLTDRAGVVLLSHVAYKSAYIADLPAITQLAHEAGALVLWDLSHTVGSVPVELDRDAVDLAVGCSYKFLNGGPGAPAWGYVASRHQESMTQPIQGWMGHADPFTMGPGYAAGHGMRRFLSGTPSILAMTPLNDMLDLIEQAGMPAIRRKAVALGEFTIEVCDALLAEHGVRVVSPREARLRAGHVTIAHPRSRELYRQLWRQDVIPDFREPDGLRLGLSPLSTSYTEVAEALALIHDLLEREA